MKFIDLPKGARLCDCDGAAVALLPDGRALSFQPGRIDADAVPFGNCAKASMHGDRLTPAEFETWLRSGKNRFDIA